MKKLLRLLPCFFSGILLDSQELSLCNKVPIVSFVFLPDAGSSFASKAGLSSASIGGMLRESCCCCSPCRSVEMYFGSQSSTIPASATLAWIASAFTRIAKAAA